SGMMTPLVVAFVVVLVVNRLYARTQALIDRVFFRARYNAGQALVRLADAMTTTLDLDRLAALITGTIDELLHPGHVALFLANDERGAFRRVGRGDGLGADTVLATCLAGRRTPLSRESLRAGLSKFVPRTVQRLIEQAPDAPEFAKRETDVSVLFVDIAGYTRLAGRLDAATVDRLVERYFGAFLDEILKRGGDVNETA